MTLCSLYSGLFASALASATTAARGLNSSETIRNRSPPGAWNSYQAFSSVRMPASFFEHTFQQAGVQALPVGGEERVQLAVTVLGSVETVIVVTGAQDVRNHVVEDAERIRDELPLFVRRAGCRLLRPVRYVGSVRPGRRCRAPAGCSDVALFCLIQCIISSNVGWL